MTHFTYLMSLYTVYAKASQLIACSKIWKAQKDEKKAQKNSKKLKNEKTPAMLLVVNPFITRVSKILF